MQVKKGKIFCIFAEKINVIIMSENKVNTSSCEVFEVKIPKNEVE